MSQIDVLIPIQDIAVEQSEILSIKRNELVPLLHDQYKLNHYADSLIQAQAVLLNGVDPHLTQQLSQTIEQLIHMLAQSKISEKRKFNALQKWLGIDLDYGSSQVEYYKNWTIYWIRQITLAVSCKLKSRNPNRDFSN